MSKPEHEPLTIPLKSGAGDRIGELTLPRSTLKLLAEIHTNNVPLVFTPACIPSKEGLIICGARISPMRLEDG